MTLTWRKSWLRLLALAAFIGITILAVSYRDDLARFSALGLPGVFIISVLSNASVFLPVPGLLVAAAAGAIYHPLLVGLVAGAGSTLGEMSGYLAGFSGQGVLEKREWYGKLEESVKKYGGPVIFTLALIPNPAFDAAGIIAGGLRMPLSRFLLWTLAGKVLKMIAVAYGGDAVVDRF